MPRGHGFTSCLGCLFTSPAYNCFIWGYHSDYLFQTPRLLIPDFSQFKLKASGREHLPESCTSSYLARIHFPSKTLMKVASSSQPTLILHFPIIFTNTTLVGRQLASQLWQFFFSNVLSLNNSSHQTFFLQNSGPCCPLVGQSPCQCHIFSFCLMASSHFQVPKDWLQ